MRRSKMIPMLLLSVAVSASGKPAWADAANADWPCIQRKVPALSAGMMWGGPPMGEGIADWRGDPRISRLVERYSVRRTSIEEAIRDIETFAAGLSDGEKVDKLTLVFTGLLEKANAERQDILDGIERFTRKQRKLADNILVKRQELEKVLLIANPTDADEEKRRSLEEQLNWQTRIHEDRERSLTYVCEIPVLLEQRLFALARELASRIE